MTPTPAKSVKTFVSYAREDAEFVLQLAADLRQAGVNIWLDQLDIPFGARWDRAVEQALEECPQMLVILSPDAVTSDNVLDEVHHALGLGRTVIPALYRECKVPYRLSRLQRIDIRAGAAGLLAALGVKREPEFPTLTEVKVEPAGPREGVGVVNGVPDILWRAIPGCQVEIAGPGNFPERPFHMAAFPVTGGQFRAFLDATDGYDSERWWNNLERQARHDAWKSQQADHPATRVSWYDAMAFSRWLSARLGFKVRLPDEREWQWAAQSAQPGFVYPWGPEWREGIANTRESGNRGTTTVGMYPAGDSRQGVSDLAGNVWEWCLNQYSKPDRTEAGGEESRVVRGGSWFDIRANARAAFRNGYHPGSRDDDFGFRMVSSAPIAGR